MKCKYCKKEIIGGRERFYCNRKCYEKYYFSQPENRKKNAEWSYKHKLRKLYKLEKEVYDELTKECSVKGCGWIYNIELHHIDLDKSNNKKDNFAPLCANHHRLLHVNKLTLKQLNEF